jgi:hypothetical protein
MRGAPEILDLLPRGNDDRFRVLQRRELMPPLERLCRVIRKHGPNRGIVGKPLRVLQDNPSEDRPRLVVVQKNRSASDGIGSALYDFDLTRFLHANRYPFSG